MIYLCIAMMVCGISSFMLGATKHYDGAGVMSWISGILLVVFFLVKRQSENGNHDTYCENTCGQCGGSGKQVTFTVGISQNSNVPAYTEVSCPRCDGKGRV